LTGFSQTQEEMNGYVCESLNKADKEVNLLYGTILSENKSDTVFI